MGCRFYSRLRASLVSGGSAIVSCDHDFTHGVVMRPSADNGRGASAKESKSDAEGLKIWK